MNDDAKAALGLSDKDRQYMAEFSDGIADTLVDGSQGNVIVAMAVLWGVADMVIRRCARGDVDERNRLLESLVETLSDSLNDPRLDAEGEA